MMKKSYLVLFLLSLLSIPAMASKIMVSKDIGFNVNDSTSFLEIALSQTVADTVVIDNVGMNWRTGPLDVNRNDLTIILERGVVLSALPGEFGRFDSLIRIRDKSNITIMGYGATVMMNKQEYIDLNDSEFRHGIDLNSAINIWIEGLTIRDSGGDGISVSKSFAADSPQNYSENITILNCISNNNYRQGLAIISAKDVEILYCEFSDTSGTLPEDGIDIEPFEPDQRIENVLIKGCRILNNHGNAIQVAMEFMDDASADISIRVEDTYMSGNHDPSNTFAYAELNIDDNGENGVDGFVNFSNCYVNSSEWAAVYISKTVDSYQANFENCVFKDVSNNTIAFNNPIIFEVTDYDNPVARFGGANFTNCTIIYDQDIPFLSLVENLATSPGLGNVMGNFYVVNPNIPSFETGVIPENVSIAVTPLNAPPSTSVGVSASQFSYSENEGLFLFTTNRESNTLYPLAVNYTFNGTADFGNDYNRQSGFVLFEEGQETTETTVGIVADEEVENTETIIVEISSNDCYVISQDAIITLELEDKVLKTNSFSLKTIKAMPNPINEETKIQLPQGEYRAILYTLTGRYLNETQLSKDKSQILMKNFPSGSYVLKIIEESTQEQKIIKLIKK